MERQSSEKSRVNYFSLRLNFFSHDETGRFVGTLVCESARKISIDLDRSDNKSAHMATSPPHFHVQHALYSVVTKRILPQCDLNVL